MMPLSICYQHKWEVLGYALEFYVEINVALTSVTWSIGVKNTDMNFELLSGKSVC